MINYQKVWATMDTDERIQFRDRTIRIVQEIYPHYKVGIMEQSDSDRFVVTNQQDNGRAVVPLRNIYSRYSTTGRTDEDLKSAVFAECAGMLEQIDDIETVVSDPEFSWSGVKEYVRIQHTRTDDIPEGKLHYPFGEDVVTALVIEIPNEGFVRWITPEMLERWEMSQDDVFKVAMDNLADLAEGLEIVGTVTPRKEMWPEQGPGYASTCVLISGLRYLLHENIGSPYRFGIPSRHRFYAWSHLDDENYQIEQKAKMEREMQRLPSALTSTIYEVDDKGQISIVKPQPVVPPLPLISNN